MRTEEVERARAREYLYQRDSAFSTNFKLIDNELWLPGETGRLVTESLTLQVLRPLFQIASSCFGSLYIYTETSYTNTSYIMTETHILDG